MGGKKKYINIFGSFTEPFNCRLAWFKKTAPLIFEFQAPPFAPKGAPLLQDAELAFTWKKVVTGVTCFFH